MVVTGVNNIGSFTQAGFGAMENPGFGSGGAMTVLVKVDWHPLAVVTVKVTVYVFPAA